MKLEVAQKDWVVKPEAYMYLPRMGLKFTLRFEKEELGIDGSQSNIDASAKN